MKKKTDIMIYQNLVTGRLPNRRVEMIKDKDNHCVIIIFRKLVKIKEDGLEDFISTPNQKVVRRPHSNHGILITNIKLSLESIGLVACMIPELNDIEFYKFDK